MARKAARTATTTAAVRGKLPFEATGILTGPLGFLELLAPHALPIRDSRHFAAILAGAPRTRTQYESKQTE